MCLYHLATHFVVDAAGVTERPSDTLESALLESIAGAEALREAASDFHRWSGSTLSRGMNLWKICQIWRIGCVN